MKVQDAMTVEVQTCEPQTNLACVAQVMWEHDCGIVPVIDEGRRVQGVVTDRDVCIALGTRNQPAASLTAGDVMSTAVRAAAPTDDLTVALAVMREGHVRRVPVVDAAGALQGLLSLDDVVLQLEERPRDAKLRDAMVSTLKVVCEKWRAPSPARASA